MTPPSLPQRGCATKPQVGRSLKGSAYLGNRTPHPGYPEGVAQSLQDSVIIWSALPQAAQPLQGRTAWGFVAQPRWGIKTETVLLSGNPRPSNCAFADGDGPCNRSFTLPVFSVLLG